MAGMMGFKRDFHNTSIAMGSRLMTKINQLDPDEVVTDCSSCRMQFKQMSTFAVKNPIEILLYSYNNCR